MEMESRGNSIRFSYRSYDANAFHYDDTYGRLNDYRGEADFIRTLVDSLSAPHDTYLEFGCGTGTLIENLDVFSEMIGVDISEGLLSMARSKGIPKSVFRLDDFMRFKSWNRKYSVINIPTFIFQTVESFDDMSVFMLSAKSCLEPFGFLVFSWIDEEEYSKKYSDGAFSANFHDIWKFEGNSNRQPNRRKMEFTFVSDSGHYIGSEAEYLIVTPEVLKKLARDSGLVLEIYEGLGNGLKEPYQKYAVFKRGGGE